MTTTIHLSNGRAAHTFATLQHALYWLSRGKRAARLLAIITQGEE